MRFIHEFLIARNKWYIHARMTRFMDWYVRWMTLEYTRIIPLVGIYHGSNVIK